MYFEYKLSKQSPVQYIQSGENVIKQFLRKNAYICNYLCTKMRTAALKKNSYVIYVCMLS